MYKFLLVIAIALCYVTKSEAAAPGCLVPGYGVFSSGPVASDPTTFFTGGSYYGSAAQCSTSPSRTYYVLTGTSAVTCYAAYSGSGSNVSPSNYARSGTKVTFNVASCPIDDYLLPLLLISGGVGFFIIRSKFNVPFKYS